MPGRIEPTAGNFRAVCDDKGCSRPLYWTVATEDHARNLVAKHDREHHPDARLAPKPAVAGEDPAPVTSYDVGAAATVFLRSHDAGAAAVWHALTGLRGQEAEHAAELAVFHSATAHAAPF